MSIFPTRILLATDGSKEAELATQTALSLAQKSGSEMHALHVLTLPLDTSDPASFEPEFRRRLEERARTRLNDGVSLIEASGAFSVICFGPLAWFIRGAHGHQHAPPRRRRCQ
ncbi:MAG: universal stress protein [Actinomycetota bacterium]|nr:universal stress protein [Actinomycetota bacterium]